MGASEIWKNHGQRFSSLYDFFVYFSHYWCILHMERKVLMKEEIKTTPNNPPVSVYDDGNIPEVDLPQSKNAVEPVEPLPESTRPRKDGPGGE